MQTELTTFALSPFLRSKLVNSGFTVVEDVVGLKPSELSKGKYVYRGVSFTFLLLYRENSTESKRQLPRNFS